MKKIITLTALAAVLFGTLSLTPAQQKSLSSTMNIYVFPTEGQDASQQSKDEAQCYTWAVEQSGSDPFDLQKQAQQQQAEAQAAQEQIAQSGKGAGAGGAVKGAAAGALIGEIVSDDPGKGAAVGAAAGMISGRRREAGGHAGAAGQLQEGVQRLPGGQGLHGQVAGTPAPGEPSYWQVMPQTLPTW